MRKILACVLVAVTAGHAVASAVDADGPRTGYFRLELTPTEMVGAVNAESMAETFPPNEKISWQLYVPPEYDPENPPGVVVFVSSIRRGGPPRAWNPTLENHNLIWIGANGAGNTAPATERMLKAIIAPFALRKDYVVDLSRSYIAGYADGAIIASMVMTTRPEQFRGGVYLGGADAWDETPDKIDLIRQNRHAFVVGTNDPRLKEIQRAFNRFKSYGVDNIELIKIRNWANRFPPPEYFGRAIDYLDDSGPTVVSESD